MAIDPIDLAKQMLEAALGTLKDKAPSVIAFARPELQKIATTVVSIEQETLAGNITQEQAALLLDMQKNASRAVLLAVEGLGLLAAEAALNAAFEVAKPIVNGALGFALFL